MHETQSPPVRLADRQWKREPLSSDLELTFFRCNHAGEDLDQRALARSILAEEAVDLALFHAYAGRIQRESAAVSLGDSGRT